MPFLDASSLETDPEGMKLLRAVIHRPATLDQSAQATMARSGHTFRAGLRVLAYLALLLLVARSRSAPRRWPIRRLRRDRGPLRAMKSPVGA